MNHTSARTAVLVLGDSAVLVAVHPRWHVVAEGLARPAAWLDAAGADVALAAVCVALLWVTAVWLGVGLLAGVGTRLPGVTGRACVRVTRITLPRILVRVVLGSTGLGLLAAPAAAQAITPPAPATSAHVVLGGVSGSTTLPRWTGPGVPTPTWPVTSSDTPVASPTWPSSSTPTTPSPTTPSPTTPSPTTPSPTPSGTPTRLPAPAPPTTGTTPPSTPTPSTPTPSTRSTGAHVHRGDSLWLLAARRLGPHADAGAVAHYWPQIYAENRGVIGDDPSVIHPGQVLHLPAPTRESS